MTAPLGVCYQVSLTLRNCPGMQKCVCQRSDLHVPTARSTDIRQVQCGGHKSHKAV